MASSNVRASRNPARTCAHLVHTLAAPQSAAAPSLTRRHATGLHCSTLDAPRHTHSHVCSRHPPKTTTPSIHRAPPVPHQTNVDAMLRIQGHRRQACHPPRHPESPAGAWHTVVCMCAMACARARTCAQRQPRRASAPECSIRSRGTAPTKMRQGSELRMCTCAAQCPNNGGTRQPACTAPKKTACDTPSLSAKQKPRTKKDAPLPPRLHCCAEQAAGSGQPAAGGREAGASRHSSTSSQEPAEAEGSKSTRARAKASRRAVMEQQPPHHTRHPSSAARSMRDTRGRCS
jgi:hypothetical protein